jgi:hypothetical protein
MIIVADQIWAQANVVFDLRQANSRNLTGLAEGPRFQYGARLVN